MDLTLDGGAGNDVLIGGIEKDTFQFTFGVGGRDVVGVPNPWRKFAGDVVAPRVSGSHI
jgi:Ca2+-binding RTX toxin-like protein